MAAPQPRQGAKAKLKTDFRQQREIQPIYTGGAVAATSDGAWLFTTLQDDVVVTNIQSGQQVARLTGDSLVTTLAATPVAHDAREATGTLLVARRSLALTFHPFPGDLEKPIKAVPRAHDAPILVSAADSTGSLFATGAADGSVKVWDAHQGHMTHVFRGHANVITSLTFDIDTTAGRARLASASEDGQVRVWDLHERQPLYIFKGHNSAVTALCFSPDASRLVSGSRDAVLLVWDTTAPSNITSKGARDAKQVGTIPVYEIIEAAGIVTVGKVAKADAKGKGKAGDTRLLVYTAGSKGKIRFWDLLSGGQVAEQQDESVATAEITNVLLLPVAGELAVVYNDHNIVLSPVASLLNPSQGTSSRQIIGYNDEVIDLVYLSAENEAKETHLAVATNSSLIRIYDLAADGGYDRTRLLSGHSDVVLSLARSSDGHLLLSGSKDKTARVWRAKESEWDCVGLLSGHLDSVGAVVLADDYAVTASGDHTVKLWPLTGLSSEAPKLTSLLTSKIHEKDINSLAIAPNGRMLASGSQDRTARLFAVGEGGKSLTPLGTFTGHKRGIWSVRFSPVDRVLATASGDRTIKLWNINDFSCLKTFEGHTNSVLRVDFITSGLQLVSSASDGLVKVWNVRDEDCVATLDNHEEKIWALTVSKDDSTIVSGAADSVITFWADVTVETQAAKAAEAEQLVIKNQDYENFLLGKDFRSAFLLALSLNQPRRLHNLFSGILASTDRQADSLTGHGAIDAAIASLQPEMLLRLLHAVRDWNAVTRTADAAQIVLHAVVKLHSPKVLLDAGVGGELLDALLPYTERHFARADRLLAQESFSLDFLLDQADVLDEDSGMMHLESSVGR